MATYASELEGIRLEAALAKGMVGHGEAPEATEKVCDCVTRLCGLIENLEKRIEQVDLHSQLRIGS